MGDVVTLPVIRIERHHDDAPSDGGKARILARRYRLLAAADEAVAIARNPDSLVMLRADPETYTAPPCDCA